MDNTTTLAEATMLFEHLLKNQLVQSKGITDRLMQDILVKIKKDCGDDSAKTEFHPFWSSYVLLVRVRNAIMAGDQNSAVGISRQLIGGLKK